MHDRTRLLGLIDRTTCELLLAEALARKFTQHAPGKFGPTGPLRHGESAHIRELGGTENDIYQNNLRHFPVFTSFVKSSFDTEKVGKAYWHRLKAGKRIYCHIDCGDYYDRTHRFQLFPQTAPGQVALIDNGEEHYESGTLLAFNPTAPHAYENRSERDCVFLVFDLYPGEYTLP